VARSSITELVLLYWGIGKDILAREKEHGWGAKVNRVGQVPLHKGRGKRIEAVIGQRHGLPVLEFGKRFEVEEEITQGVVPLRGGDIDFVRDRIAGEERNACMMTAFRDVVIPLPLVFLSAELAGDSGGEIVREGQEDLGARGLQERPPGLAG